MAPTAPAVPVGHFLAQRVPRVVLFALLMHALAAPGAAAATDPPEPWKLSAAVGPAFALGKAGERWAKLIAEKSGGKVAVRFFPGATLAARDPAREFIALRDGAADLAVGSTLFWSVQVARAQCRRIAVDRARGQGLAALATGDASRQGSPPRSSAPGVVPLAFAPLGHRELAATAAAAHARRLRGAWGARSASTPYSSTSSRASARAPRAMSFADAQAAFRAGTLDAQEGRSRRSPPRASTRSASGT